MEFGLRSSLASTVLELSYVGNGSYGLWGSHPGNQPLTPGPGGVNTQAVGGLYDRPVTTSGHGAEAATKAYRLEGA